MQKIKQYVIIFISFILCITMTGCFNSFEILKKLNEMMKESQTESWTTTVFTETSREETMPESFEKPSRNILETIANTTVASSRPAVDSLLPAEAFTIEDIIANGPLYDRRHEFDPQFIEDALAYFPEIAGGNEFDPSIESFISKWDISLPINIALLSDFTEEDKNILNKVIPPIEILTKLDIRFVEPTESYNYEYHVLPLDKFPDIFPDYHPDNWGLVNIWSDNNQVRYYCISAVSNDYPNRLEMNHLLIEEFIQSLGLPNDSYHYEDSIFQQNWTDVQEPMPIDWLLLEFLYRPELTPGMYTDQCVTILRSLYLD